MPADEVVVSRSRGETVAGWIFFVALGAGAGALIQPLAGLLLRLPFVPFEGLIEFVESWPRPEATIGLMLAIGAVGLLAAGDMLGGIQRVTVGPDVVEYVVDDKTTRIERHRVSAVYVDHDQLILLGPATEVLIQEPTGLEASDLGKAFRAHGYPWYDRDPYSEKYRRWVPWASDLPSGADDVFRAREQALTEGRQDDAANLRHELAKLGVVVRDKNTKQYWRRVRMVGMTASPAGPPPASAVDAEVVDLCGELLRIDTSNFGDDSGPGERKAAEYVAEKLAEVGLETTVFEAAPGRTTVVARIDGADPQRTDALLMHGHLDVVPADAADWMHHPFSGEIADGCLWGRGAVDMKDMDAMILSVIRHRLRTGRPPARPVVLAFLADEEAGGRLGAHWAVDHHAELFDGVTEAISEVGGFSLTVRDDLRLYLIETAQKGIEWMRLTVDGRAGHGSMISPDNAVTELAEAVARLGQHQWPVRLTPTVRAFLEAASEAYGVEFDPDDPEAMLHTLGFFGRIAGATLRNTANPTMLRAGYKHNVVPGRAEAYVDGRFLPGYEEEFNATLDAVLGPKVKRESVVHDISVETEFSGSLVDAMTAALLAEDPDARTVPYCLSGGTDAKSFSTLGIRNFGFAPLRLPPELDFSGMFHGVDERVPVESLRFGARVLDRFLDLA